MATATKTQTDAIQDATAQAQEIAERWVETSKKAAGEYLTLTEKTTESFVGIQRQGAEQTDVEWLASHKEAQAKFTGDVGGLSVVPSERIEEPLDECVVGGVQEDTGPQAAGFEAHPGENETHGNDHYGEARQTVPGRRARVVVAINQDGVVPEGPDDTAEERRRRERSSL